MSTIHIINLYFILFPLIIANMYIIINNLTSEVMVQVVFLYHPSGDTSNFAKLHVCRSLDSTILYTGYNTVCNNCVVYNLEMSIHVERRWRQRTFVSFTCIQRADSSTTATTDARRPHIHCVFVCHMTSVISIIENYRSHRAISTRVWI